MAKHRSCPCCGSDENWTDTRREKGKLEKFIQDEIEWYEEEMDCD